MTADLSAHEITQRLAARIVDLSRFLLPKGYREGAEWRCGSIAGESGDSLGVHLTGTKAGIWCDFSTGQKGDALDLVRQVLGLKMATATRWSLRWLELDHGELPKPETIRSKKRSAEPTTNPDRWRKVWEGSRPIADTTAEQYLCNRGLTFDDPGGSVLRFAVRRARKNPVGELEYHGALIALLRDFRTGEPCGVINIYLQPDGRDRLRDRKGRTVTGRAKDAAVMLDDFADVTLGLIISEGVETAIALWMADLRPVWALGSAGNLATFPVLGGINAVTIAADADERGQRAAAAVIDRWSSAGREVLTIAPRSGDWADPAKRRRVS